MRRYGPPIWITDGAELLRLGQKFGVQDDARLCGLELYLQLEYPDRRRAIMRLRMSMTINLLAVLGRQKLSESSEGKL